MPRRRFELLRAYAHHPLKMACLPFHHLGKREEAGVAGFEPTTCGFGDRCSSQLSYTPIPLGRLERPTRGLGNRCSIHLSYRGLEIGGLEPPTSCMRGKRSPAELYPLSLCHKTNILAIVASLKLKAVNIGVHPFSGFGHIFSPPYHRKHPPPIG